MAVYHSKQTQINKRTSPSGVEENWRLAGCRRLHQHLSPAPSRTAEALLAASHAVAPVGPFARTHTAHGVCFTLADEQCSQSTENRRRNWHVAVILLWGRRTPRGGTEFSDTREPLYKQKARNLHTKKGGTPSKEYVHMLAVALQGPHLRSFFAMLTPV